MAVRAHVQREHTVNYNISYTFRLIDQFSAGAGGMAAAAGRLTSAMSRLGVAGAAAGAGLGAVFVGGLQAAAKFEDKMSEVRKVVPDMTKDMMWKMGDEVMRLSAWSGMAKNDVAEIFASGARMGIRGTDALSKFAETIVKVKTAWDGVSAKDAGEAMATISGKFFGNIDPLEAQKRMIGVADAINYLGQNTAAVKPSELLKFFQRGGAQLSMMGFTPEEASAYGAAALTSGSNSGAMEGTLTRSTMQRLRTNAIHMTKGKKALADLGLDSTQFGIALNKNGPEAIMELMDRVAKVPANDRGMLLKNLLGDQRATSQFENIIKQLNEYKRALATTSPKWAERFLKDKDFVDWLGKARPDQLKLLQQQQGSDGQKTPLSLGSVDQEFKARMETLVQQMNRASEAFDNMRITMTKPILEPLAGGFSWLADMTESFRQSESAVKALGVALGVVGAAGALAGLGALTAWATGMSSAMAGLMLLGAGALGLTVAVALVGAGAWIFMNWDSFVAKVTQPLDIKINWPNAPDWLQWLPNLINDVSGARDKELRAQEKFRKIGFEDDAYQPRWAMPSNADGMAKVISDAARRGAAGDPFAQFPMVGGINKPGGGFFNTMADLGRSDQAIAADAAWAGKDNIGSSSPAASIPQSVSVSIDPVTFNPATVNVNVTGQVNGPLQGTGSGTLQAEAARGTSTGNVGGGVGNGNPMGPR